MDFEGEVLSRLEIMKAQNEHTARAIEAQTKVLVEVRDAVLELTAKLSAAPSDSLTKWLLIALVAISIGPEGIKLALKLVGGG